MKKEILRMLRESDGFVSGQEICDKLSVSRTAVWKAMNQLKEDNYVIEAVRNKGYRLIESPDILSEEEISAHLNTKWIGRKKVLYFDSVDSTNNVVKKEAEKELVDGLVVVADEQVAGRGRRGHVWQSPKGTGAWMSFMVTPNILPEKASMLTLVAAMAVASGIEEITGLDTKIKWPNDIVVDGHKVCGMLTEMSAEMTSLNYVVIGIGINVNMESFPDDIKDIASSLYIETGKKAKINRADIIDAELRYFEKYYDEFLKTEDLSLLIDEYNRKLVNAGRQVRLIGKEDERVLKAIGIDKEGMLIVCDENGNEERVRSGEVSVRGLYGYT